MQKAFDHLRALEHAFRIIGAVETPAWVLSDVVGELSGYKDQVWRDRQPQLRKHMCNYLLQVLLVSLHCQFQAGNKVLVAGQKVGAE